MEVEAIGWDQRGRGSRNSAGVANLNWPFAGLNSAGQRRTQLGVDAETAVQGGRDCQGIEANLATEGESGNFWDAVDFVKS